MTESNGPEVRSPSPQAILTCYWLGVPEGLLPLDTAEIRAASSAQNLILNQRITVLYSL